jgi:hypothetical protein
MVSNLVFMTVTIAEYNQAPIIHGALPGKNIAIHEGNGTEFSINMTEPDDEPVTITWRFNGELMNLPEGTTAIQYDSDYASSGVHLIEVEVNDGHLLNSTAFYKWNLTVMDSLVIDDLTPLSDGVLESGEEIEFSVTVFDPEGGELEYKWFVDGVFEPGTFGLAFGYFHESLDENSTYHTITFHVINELGLSNEGGRCDRSGKQICAGNGGRGEFDHRSFDNTSNRYINLFDIFGSAENKDQEIRGGSDEDNAVTIRRLAGKYKYYTGAVPVSISTAASCLSGICPGAAA